MRYQLLTSTLVVAWVLVALVPQPIPSQPAHAQTRDVAPGPYKPVAITLPIGLGDPSFEAFRNQLGQIATKKDRAALARIVAANFFWIPEDTDLADKGKPAIDNIAKALALDGTDSIGWDTLVAYAEEKTAMVDSQRKGVFCAPGEPGYDDNAAIELATATQTIGSDWMYPLRDGVEVRSIAKPDAPVAERLGLHLVRVLPDDSPANAVTASFHKVMTPSGKIGFVAVNALRDISEEQLCYVKEPTGWKIAGFFGGEPSQ